MKIKNNPGGIVEILEKRNPVRGESGNLQPLQDYQVREGLSCSVFALVITD